MIPKTSQGFPGMSWALRTSQMLPRTFLGHAGLRKTSLGSSWVSRNVPGASPGLPGLSGRPRCFPGSPWASPDVPGTSPGFPGPPGRPRGFPGPPWDIRTFQGLPRASLESLRFPRMPQGLPKTLCGLPDFHSLPKASLGSLVLRTSRGLPRALRGQSGPSRVSLTLPWILWDLH